MQSAIGLAELERIDNWNMPNRIRNAKIIIDEIIRLSLDDGLAPVVGDNVSLQLRSHIQCVRYIGIVGPMLQDGRVDIELSHHRIYETDVAHITRLTWEHVFTTEDVSIVGFVGIDGGGLGGVIHVDLQVG